MCHRCYRQKSVMERVIAGVALALFFTVPIGYMLYDAAGMPERDDLGQVTQKRVIEDHGDTRLMVHVHASDGFGRDDEVSVALFNRLQVGSPAVLTVRRYRIGHREQTEGVRYPI